MTSANAASGIVRRVGRGRRLTSQSAPMADNIAMKGSASSKRLSLCPGRIVRIATSMYSATMSAMSATKRPGELRLRLKPRAAAATARTAQTMAGMPSAKSAA